MKSRKEIEELLLYTRKMQEYYMSIFKSLPQEFRKESSSGITDAIAMPGDIFNPVSLHYISVWTEEELAEIKEKQRLRERNAMYQRRRRAKFMPKTKAIRAKVQEAEIKEALENASAKAEKLLMADNDTHIAEVVAGENKVYVDTGIFPTAEEVKEKYAI